MKRLAIAALAAMLMAVAAAAQTDIAITLLSGTTTFSSNGGFSTYSGTTNIDCRVNIGPAQRANLSMTVSQFSPGGGPIVSSGADGGLSFNCTGMLSPIFMHNQASFCSPTRASAGTSHTLIRFSESGGTRQKRRSMFIVALSPRNLSARIRTSKRKRRPDQRPLDHPRNRYAPRSVTSTRGV